MVWFSLPSSLKFYFHYYQIIPVISELPALLQPCPVVGDNPCWEAAFVVSWGGLGWAGSWFLCLVLCLRFWSCAPFSLFPTLPEHWGSASLGGIGECSSPWAELGVCIPQRRCGAWAVTGEAVPVLSSADFYLYCCSLSSGSQRNILYFPRGCSEWTGLWFGGRRECGQCLQSTPDRLISFQLWVLCISAMHGKFSEAKWALLLLFIALKRLNASHRQTDKTPQVLCVELGAINMEIWAAHWFSCPGLVKFHV